MGAIRDEMELRLRENFRPTRMELVDDSTKHAGHSGHNPAGESHFSLFIESELFIGKSRVERQRAINRALADLLQERVHALAIRAAAPGE